MVWSWRFLSQRAGTKILSIIIVGKKMAPCVSRGPAVELLPLQAMQQGAGERIPVARLKLFHRRETVKPFAATGLRVSP